MGLTKKFFIIKILMDWTFPSLPWNVSKTLVSCHMRGGVSMSLNNTISPTSRLSGGVHHSGLFCLNIILTILSKKCCSFLLKWKFIYLFLEKLKVKYPLKNTLVSVSDHPKGHSTLSKVALSLEMLYFELKQSWVV